VPEGWEATVLQDLCSGITSGGTPKKIDGMYGGSINWFRTNELDDAELSSSEIKITEKAISKSAAKIYPENTLLVAMYGATIGKTGLVKVPSASNQACCAITPDSSKCSTHFLWSYLKWIKPQLIKMGRGAGQPNINQGMLKVLNIPTPPLPEQKKIAAILSSVDDTIAKTKAVIAQTKKLKQGLMQELLTRGIGHTNFKKTEIGEIPESWEVYKANDLCSQVSVGIVVKPTQYYTESGVKCFRSANVREGYIEDKNWVYISEADNKVLKKSRLQTGDVLVVRTGYPGTSCVVTEEFNGSNCVDIVFARPLCDKISPNFLSTYINSTEGKKQIFKGQSGLAQKHFNVKSLQKLMIPLPTCDEQKEIMNVLSGVENRFTKEAKCLDQLEVLKQSLMNQLLSGSIRVKVS
jgi:type I restriction enzyme S subunit